MLGEGGDAGDDLVRVGREQVMRDHPREPLEPEGAELSENGALVRDRLAQHHVERAHTVARDHEQRLAVHFVDLAHFPSP